MGVVVLHVFGVALETVLGIDAFCKTFSKRKEVECKHIASEYVLNSLLVCIIGMNFLQGISETGMLIFYLTISGIFLFYRLYVEKKVFICEQIRKVINAGIFWAQLFGAVAILAWTGWLSYISTSRIMAGNLFLPFLLYRYYKCSLVQAYIYEVLYLSTIGLMKNTYMVFVGAVGQLGINSVNLSGIMHTYPVVMYEILICILIYFCVKYFAVGKLLFKVMTQHKVVMILGTIGEFQLLSLLTDLGVDRFNVKDLCIALLFTVGVILILLFVLAKTFLNRIEGEKKILDVRNDAMEQQYQELQDAYQQNRCLIHDEKHMIQYMVECLENNETQKALNFAQKYREDIAKQSKHAWTGLPTLDFVLNIKKRKMDVYSIEFSLNAQLEHLMIDDADFVVLMGNLFDNAIDAAKQCEVGKREINLSLRNVNEMFLLQMRNTSTQMPKRKKGQFVTSKQERNKHGLGLESVRRIVEKYEGCIDFEYDTTMFQVKILIAENS